MADRVEDFLARHGVTKVFRSAADKFLAHHGVKGMKWGVRKDTTTGSTYVKSGITNGNYGGVGSLRVGSYRAGDHTKSRLKGTGLNAIGAIPSAFVSPLASHWGNVKPVVDIRLKEINKHYSSSKNDLASNAKLKDRYDTEVQKMVENVFKNTVVKGMVLPSASAKITAKRVGDLQKAQYQFYTNGKTAFMRVTSGKRSADLRVGNFKAQKLIKHSADNADQDESFDIPVLLTRDSSGLIINIAIPDLETADKTDHGTQRPSADDAVSK